MSIPPPIRRGLFLFCSAALLVVTLMPSALLPEAHGADKVEHALAFAILTVLAVWSLPWRAWKLVIMLIAFGILIEILQAVLPFNRDAEAWDVLADSIGIAAGMAAELWVLRLTRRE